MPAVVDPGRIKTFTAEHRRVPHISVATEGGAGAPAHDIAIEADGFIEGHRKMRTGRLHVHCGPVRRPLGERRSHVRDPFGRLANMLENGQKP